MTNEQTRRTALIGGVMCFLTCGPSVLMRALGAEALAVDQTSWLASLGLLLVAAGAGSRHR